MKGKEEEDMRHMTYVRICFIVLVLTFGMLVSSAIAQEEPCVFFLETDGVIVIHGYDENGTPVQIYNSANELKWDDDVGIEPIVISGLAPGTYMLVGPPDGRMFGATNEVGEPVVGPAEAGAKALFSVASPGPLEVITVPWVATSLTTPHPAYNGHPTTFKAIARGGDGMYTYEWDFNGDGVYDYSNATPNPYDLSAKYTYPDQTSYKLFIARIRVTSGGETVTGEYRVSVVPSSTPPIPVRASVAIDDGLWRLHLDQYRYSSGGVDYGYWDNSPGCCGYDVFTSSPTASAVHAFEINGHLEVGNYDTDPYVETVSRGLKYMFTTLNSVSIGSQTYGNPDTNGNGIGIQVNSWRSIYELGQVMDAIAASGTPDAVATTGGANILGRTYKDILTDMVDMYAWGQYDHATVGGGWRYSWNEWPDNSAAQWGAIGMLAAEEVFGISVPQWVKDRNDVWLNYSYDGTGFGYTGAATGSATTPGGMVQLAFDDKLTADPRWVTAEAWIANNWIWWKNSQYYYAYYAFAKAMREAQQDADPEPEPITLLSNGIDWYGDPDIGLARRLVDTQLSNGGWPYMDWPYVGYDLTNAWCVIILQAGPCLFCAPPVAIAKAIPTEANPGDFITFDHSGSYHLDPGKSLVAFRWDFDEDGVWDYETSDINAKPTHQYFDEVKFCDQIIEHIVKLEVEDEDGLKAEDDTSVIIKISKYNHPPVADADPTDSDPNYEVGKGGIVILDASQSYDPDEDETPFDPSLPYDHIVSYEWDLDNDGVYDVEGMTYPFDIPDDWEEYTTHVVQLKVTDDGTWAGPCGGSLYSETSATIYVLPCIAGAQVVIYPDTFNKSKHGKWVTGHITPPEGYDASDVVGATITMVDGQACMIVGKMEPPEPIYVVPGDPGSGIAGYVAVAKFDAEEVNGLLPVPVEGSAGEGKSGRIEDVPVCVIAVLSDGANTCEVCDTIDVIYEGK